MFSLYRLLEVSNAVNETSLIKNRQFILKNSFYDFCPNQSKGLQRISSRLFLSPVKDLGRVEKLPAFVANESSCKTCQITTPFN